MTNDGSSKRYHIRRWALVLWIMLLSIHLAGVGTYAGQVWGKNETGLIALKQSTDRAFYVWVRSQGFNTDIRKHGPDAGGEWDLKMHLSKNVESYGIIEFLRPWLAPGIKGYHRTEEGFQRLLKGYGEGSTTPAFGVRTERWVIFAYEPDRGDPHFDPADPAPLADPAKRAEVERLMREFDPSRQQVDPAGEMALFKMFFWSSAATGLNVLALYMPFLLPIVMPAAIDGWNTYFYPTMLLISRMPPEAALLNRTAVMVLAANLALFVLLMWVLWRVGVLKQESL